MAAPVPTLVRAVTLRLLLVATSLSALGCATPYAKLDGILAGNRPAPSGGPPRVTLTHGGTTQAGVPQTAWPC